MNREALIEIRDKVAVFHEVMKKHAMYDTHLLDGIVTSFLPGNSTLNSHYSRNNTDLENVYTVKLKMDQYLTENTFNENLPHIKRMMTHLNILYKEMFTKYI